MYLTLIIPNSVYLPDSEATPDLRLCSVPIGEQGGNPGVTFVRNAFAFEYSEQAQVLTSVTSLLESFEDGVAEANDKTYDQFDEAMLKESTPDAELYRWLKQAVAYSRVGLTDADEANPPLEVFVVTADSPVDWD